MIQIGETLLSEDILQEQFVCDLSRCRGICCVEGDCGAPLDENEKKILEDIYPVVDPYLSEESRKCIAREGKWTTDPFDRQPCTPIINGKDCVYVIYDKEGHAKCAIEQAFLEGKTNWKKPISCHLYPIRLSPLMSLTALNYHRWNVCKDACTLGKELRVPVYKFLKEPLIRRFGKGWYRELETVAREYLKQFPRQ